MSNIKFSEMVEGRFYQAVTDEQTVAGVLHDRKFGKIYLGSESAGDTTEVIFKEAVVSEISREQAYDLNKQ